MLWDGEFDPALAGEIGIRYNFLPNFDLGSSLSEAAWRYRQRKNGWQSAKQLDGEAKRARLTGQATSMLIAIKTELWATRNPSKAKARPTERGRISAAMRDFSKINKKNGSPPDFAAISLFRTLGAIYEDGTGRKPYITRTPNGGFRGRPYGFVKEVCEEMGVSVWNKRLREVGYRNRKVRKLLI